jgi:hypothetical protein
MAKPDEQQRNHIAAFSSVHLPIFVLCWFPLNPISLNLYRNLAFNGLSAEWKITDCRQFVGLLTTSILGPYTAATEGRNRQFCLDAASRYLPYCAGAVCFGVLTQVLWRPKTRCGKVIRQLTWAAGWLVWFGGAFVSILNNSG